VADLKSNQNVQLYASVSPHVRHVLDLRRVMWFVNLALLPATIAAVYYFREAALLHIVLCVVSCVAVEAIIQKMSGQPVTISDGSAVLTGLLLALNLPPNVPYWMGIIGGVIAIGVVKHCFGGLGYNIFNPALAARGFLLIAFAQDMSTGWAQPGVREGMMNGGLTQVDALTGATALDALKHLSRSGAEIQIDWQVIKNLFIGKTGGCLGETSALFLLVGAAFLFWKKIITWHIPLSYCLTVFLIGIIQGLVTGTGWEAGVFHLMAGGLILGAFYMATDLVTSPVSPKGRIIFGAGCGILTMVIRIFGGYPEGVSFAILLMNCTTPLLDRYARPKPFGTQTLKQQQKQETAAG
jgi:electron transport complex protein RnfD